MIVVVNDANVLIDLIKLDLLLQFFELPFDFHTTDFILKELHMEQKECLTPFMLSGAFKILSLSAEDLIEIYKLQSEKTQLSIQDCSAIFCSKNINGSLITSDNNLRKFATTKNVTVRGHLWVFDQMVEHGKLSPKEAIVKLTELNTKINVRLKLPKLECEIRIKKWKNSY